MTTRHDNTKGWLGYHHADRHYVLSSVTSALWYTYEKTKNTRKKKLINPRIVIIRLIRDEGASLSPIKVSHRYLCLWASLNNHPWNWLNFNSKLCKSNLSFIFLMIEIRCLFDQMRITPTLPQKTCRILQWFQARLCFLRLWKWKNFVCDVWTTYARELADVLQTY